MGRGWEGGGQFESNLGPKWIGSHHAKGEFPSQKKGMEGEVNRELARGVKKGIAP
jgi:hypothetical protein